MPLTSLHTQDYGSSISDTGAAAQSHKIRIAVADGQPIRRGCLRKALTSKGDFQVVAEARNGAEVSDVLAEYGPDILLLDLNMPSLDGLAVLRKLRHFNRNTKVIVLAAPEDQPLFVQAMKLGACGIVGKQSGDELLFKSIRKVYAGEIWLDNATMSAVMRQFSSPSGRSGENCEDPIRVFLSRREQEIVALIAQGFRNKEIASQMDISDQTVKNHLHNIFDRLSVSNRLDVALYAIHHNIQGLRPEDRHHPPAPNPPAPVKKYPMRRYLPGTRRYAARSAGCTVIRPPALRSSPWA
jgi:DNA-binding NarL/FixJ family response regulator